MRPNSRATRIALRRAAWASVVLHVVVACALVLLVRSLEKRERDAPGLDTRAADEPQVRISLTEDAPVIFEKPPANTSLETGATKTPEPPLPVGPLVPTVPRTLPPELVAVIRKPAPAPAGGAVVEVPLPANAANPSVIDPNVQPAGSASNPMVGTPDGGSARAIHGALKPGQTVVYLLDCSGSMGAEGKFEVARAALVATLNQQPATVRFQVIVYAGTAKPLLATDGNALLANGANVRAATEKLAGLEPRGLSDHFGAVRAALAFRPDVILLLTDADNLSAATIASVLASASKAITVWLGQVTAEDVQRPRELK